MKDFQITQHIGVVEAKRVFVKAALCDRSKGEGAKRCNENELSQVFICFHIRSRLKKCSNDVNDYLMSQ